MQKSTLGSKCCLQEPTVHATKAQLGVGGDTGSEVKTLQGD